ncbi:hypothetical protein ABTM86_19505, partial [Acinetobacter baumannii]
LAHYELVVYERPNHQIKNLYNSNIVHLTAPLLDISATYIRSLIKEHKSIKYLVPDKVREEIEKGNYYK